MADLDKMKNKVREKTHDEKEEPPTPERKENVFEKKSS